MTVITEEEVSSAVTDCQVFALRLTSLLTDFVKVHESDEQRAQVARDISDHPMAGLFLLSILASMTVQHGPNVALSHVDQAQWELGTVMFKNAVRRNLESR